MTDHQWRHDVSDDRTEVEVLCSVCGAWPTETAMLVDWATGEHIRAATCDDRRRAEVAACVVDDGCRVFVADGRLVWVRS